MYCITLEYRLIFRKQYIIILKYEYYLELYDRLNKATNWSVLKPNTGTVETVDVQDADEWFREKAPTRLVDAVEIEMPDPEKEVEFKKASYEGSGSMEGIKIHYNLRQGGVHDDIMGLAEKFVDDKEDFLKEFDVRRRLLKEIQSAML